MMRLIETIDVQDLFNTSGGVFTALATYDATLTDPQFPWLTTALANEIDKQYYLQHSGSKTVSRLFLTLKKLEDDGTITDALTEIAKMVETRFAFTWNKIRVAWETNYAPLENYDMEQTETPDITKTRNVASNVSTTTTDDITDNGIYGFNSSGSSANPQTKSTRNGTVTVSGDADDNIETETETGTRGLTRHGNIGVTTSQQMLQSEIDLRTKFNFMNQIMNDMDSILCLLVY